MSKYKSLITLFIIPALSLLITSCGMRAIAPADAVEDSIPSPVASNAAEASDDEPITEEPTTMPADEDTSESPEAGEPSPTPEKRPEIVHDDNIDAFTELTYNITAASQENDGIDIVYPVISGLGDPKTEEKINELIKNDAMKYAVEYGSDSDALDVDFEISWAGEMLLSVKFFIYSNVSGAAHPNHMFYTSNIYIPMASKITLGDMVRISDYMAKAFKKSAGYVAPLDNGDALAAYLDSIDGAYLETADSSDAYNSCFSYFTEDSIGISIEAPFAVGGYALYEVKYEDIISYIYKRNEMWKDFPDLIAGIFDAGNNSVTSEINDFIPEGWTIFNPYGGDPISQGDFDKNGTTDLAFVVEGPEIEMGEAPERTLLVLWGYGDWTYRLALEAKNAILRADEGGIMGDPFEMVEIKDNCIFLRFYGGSSWRWQNSYQFRYQEGDFYLIGATESFKNTNSNEGTVKDYNLSTGDYVITETAEDGTENVTNGNHDKRNKYRLSEFDTGDEDIFSF